MREGHPVTEKELHRQLSDLLRSMGVPFGHARMDKRSTLAVGYPDFTFPFGGKFVAWEAKVGKNKLSPEQEAFRRQIEICGGVYRVITNLDEALAHIQSMSPGK